MKPMIYLFEEIIESKSNTTIMTLIEKRCLLAIYESSSFILLFFGISTDWTAEVPKVISNLLKLLHPRGT
jgi:hypothetical protein